MDWELIVCFEVHVELKTESKLFCGCPTLPGAAPNSHICPVCTGQPGSLPVLNRRAIEYALRAGIALNCDINHECRFARKNYFYPDLPKGYQISQYEAPLCERGSFEITDDNGVKKTIGIKRIHLEEDAGKLVHSSGSLGGSDYTLVDFNRSGIPLLEIVADHEKETVGSASEARRYLEGLRQTLRDIEISECAIEKGQFRCDVNISVRGRGEKTFNPRTEIKNMSSFKFIEEAIQFEKERQTALLAKGDLPRQETRLFDEKRRITVPMRGKEDAPDYRYFPDPDLLELRLDEAYMDSIRKEIPRPSTELVEGLIKDYGLSLDEAQLLVRERDILAYFRAACEPFGMPKQIAKWIIKDIFSLINNACIEISCLSVTPQSLAALVKEVEDGRLTEALARDLLKEMFKTGKELSEISSDKELTSIKDEEFIRDIVTKVVEANQDAVKAVRNGKKETINFLVGQIMRITARRADVRAVKRILLEMISSGLDIEK